MNCVCAGSTDRVTEACMQRVCPDEYKALAEACNNASQEALSTFAEGYKNPDCEAEVAKLDEVWTAFYKKFEAETKIEINFEYHDPDRGEREDDVSGWFISADFDSLYQKTPAHEALTALCGESPTELVRYVDNG